MKFIVSVITVLVCLCIAVVVVQSVRNSAPCRQYELIDDTCFEDYHKEGFFATPTTHICKEYGRLTLQCIDRMSLEEWANYNENTEE